MVPLQDKQMQGVKIYILTLMVTTKIDIHVALTSTDYSEEKYEL